MRTESLGVVLLLATGCGSNIEIDMNIDGGEVPFQSIVADLVDRGAESSIIRVVGALDIQDSRLENSSLMFEVALDKELMMNAPLNTDFPIRGTTRYQSQLPGTSARSDPSFSAESDHAELIDWAFISKICPTCAEPRGGSQEFSGNLLIQDRNDKNITFEINVSMTGRIASRDTTERAVVSSHLTLGL